MIYIKNRNYGCFTATLRCDECNKINLAKEFSWDRDHIGIGEKEKIKGVMLLESEKREINYCVKCGKSLAVLLVNKSQDLVKDLVKEGDTE